MRITRLLGSALVVAAVIGTTPTSYSVADEGQGADEGADEGQGADEGESSAIALRFAPTPGEAISYRVHMDGAQTVSVDGKENVTRYDTTTDLQLVFDEPGNDGSRHARLRYGSVSGWMEAPGLDRLVFDSSAAPPKDPEPAAIAAAFTAFAGQEFALTFDDHGAVTRIDGVRKVVSELAGRGPDAAARRTFFARIIRRDAIEQQVGWYLLVTPLPDGTLTRGDGWVDTNAVPGLSGFRAVATLTHRLVSSGGGVTKLASRGKLAVESTRPELRGSLVVKRADFEAQSRLADADGLPLNVRSSLDLDLSLPTRKAKVRQTTRFDVTRQSGAPTKSSSVTHR